MLPDHGFILLTMYPDHIKIDTSRFIPPDKPYELSVHEFGDDRDVKNIGKPIMKIDGDIVSTKTNLAGRSIALSTGSIISYGIVAFTE